MTKNPKNLSGLLLIILIIAIIGGWYFFPLIKEKTPFKPKKSILEQIQEQDQAQGFTHETRSLRGKVTATQENALLIEANLPSQNANIQQIPTTRKIIIGPETTLSRLISLPKGKKDGQILYSNTMVAVKLSEIKIGDMVEVYANEDIKNKEEITPKQVILTANQ